MRNKKWETFLHDRKSMGLCLRKSKPEGSTVFSKHIEVRTATELGVVGRSSEPESIDVGRHIWP